MVPPVKGLLYTSIYYDCTIYIYTVHLQIADRFDTSAGPGSKIATASCSLRGYPGGDG